MKTIRAKVVIIGPHSVGKTSIVTRYQSKIFTPNTSCTVGASFSQIQIITEGVKVKMQVWDTAGQERFRSMAPMYYRGANGALLMYDLTNSETLDDLKDWSKDLLSLVDPDLVTLVVAGNKCDLVDERQVTEREGRNFAKEIEAHYFETSAYNNTGVNEVFECFAEEIGRKLKGKLDEDPDLEDVKLSSEKQHRNSTSRKCC